MVIEVNNCYPELVSPEAEAVRIFEALRSSGRFPIGDGELSVVFVSDSEIAEIHEDFMQDPTATDVITFPADLEMQHAGEIIVSVDHAKARAQALKLPFSDELCLYLIHGWLHLAGLDDLNEADRKKMRVAEAEAVSLIRETIGPPKFCLKSSKF